MTESDRGEPLVLVLFGARGDLARRMLFPSLYRLAAKGRLPDKFAIIGSGRTAPDSDDQFRDDISHAIAEDIDEPDNEILDDLMSRLSFQAASDDDGSDLAEAVRAKATQLGDGARTLIYLSVPPTAMQPLIGMLGRQGLAEEARFIVEKPFGTDLESSRELDQALKAVTDEDHVYRIDHFLGKEAVRTLMALRFANGVIESLWNREHVESVQIDEGLVENVSIIFAQTQTSVLTESRSMLARLGRPNYVTPTNYLELVKGYCKLLGEKRGAVGDQANKLKNGLQKLSDTAVQVGEMSLELEQKKKVVAKAQTETEELLVVIVQENHVVAEQQKQVIAIDCT